MDKSLSVVLPVHNAERTLRRDVAAVLEAAAELTSAVEVLVVDDGSTDDTFETASELAVTFPQVRVIRHSQRGGLTEALARVRAGLESDIVIVHDGASRIDAEQLRRVWTQQQTLGALEANRAGVSFADLRQPAATQAALESAHRRLLGFQRIAPAATTTTDDEPLERRDVASNPAPAGKGGVGAIPPLPAMRQGVINALSDFAFGE